MDFKCPSSAMEKKNLWSIVDDLQPHDEIKFVIGNRTDFDWSCKQINKYSLNDKCVVLFSPVFDEIEPATIVNWITDENVPVRFQLQTHKIIWDNDKKSV